MLLILISPSGWGYILGLGIISAMVSNLTLIMAIQKISSTKASILGALKSLTAVLIGLFFFKNIDFLNGNRCFFGFNSRCFIGSFSGRTK